MKHAAGVLMRAVFALTLFLSGASFAAGSNQFYGFPTRVLEVEGGGLVEFQGLVIWDNRTARAVDERSLLKYILAITNKSDFPVWIECEWNAPEQAPFTAMAKFEPKQFREGFLKTKKVAWDRPVPIKVTVYGDEKKTRRLGGRDVVLRFNSGREKFEADIGKVQVDRFRVIGGDAPSLSGFQEMDLTKAVPGTKAEEWVAMYIRMSLWAHESRLHWDCAHEIIGARPVNAEEPLRFDGMTVHGKPVPAGTRRSMEENRAKPGATVEEWQIRSCDNVSTYVVVARLVNESSINLDVARMEGAKAP